MNAADPLAIVGTTVSEKYEIEQVVGEGGFAVVYRARHKVWNRPVAIKVFRTLGDLEPGRRAELVESFINEGRLLAELSELSAAICQARDVGVLVAADGREIPYMVLEWLEGRSLEHVIAGERSAHLPPRAPSEAILLLEPVAEALALAHRKGIAHRDVKPANIFILGDPRGEHTVKLLDFGIAKVVQDVQRLGGSFDRTQGTMSSFTPTYGAPEQFARTLGATGPWTDVFSLALIFVELITHRAALSGDDLTQLAFSSMDPNRRPTPRNHGAVVTDAVEAVFLRALAVAPEHRFRAMSDFWRALRAALAMDPSKMFVDSSRESSLRLEQQPMPSVASRPDPLRSTSGFPDESVIRAPNASKSPLLLFLGLGVVVALVAGALVLGVYHFALKGKVAIAVPTPPASSAPPAIAEAPRPVAGCPAGMTKIPGGKFFMGTDDKGDEPGERPAHQVTLAPYCIDTTEVTVDQYKRCSDSGECKRAPKENDWPGIDAASHKLYDPLCNIREADSRGNYPINCIDWSLANAFCSAVDKRLPTEAEWEFATRGSDGRKYPWGDDTPMSGDRLNACGKECVAWGKKHPDPENPLAAMYAADDGFPTTAPVGSFPKGASPFGVQDVVGNVWEWVADWYAPYAAGPATDPKGADQGDERVLRGGSWNGSDPAWVRPTYRFKSSPTLRSHGIGVRCARSSK